MDDSIPNKPLLRKTRLKNDFWNQEYVLQMWPAKGKYIEARCKDPIELIKLWWKLRKIIKKR